MNPIKKTKGQIKAFTEETNEERKDLFQSYVNKSGVQRKKLSFAQVAKKNLAPRGYNRKTVLMVEPIEL